MGSVGESGRVWRAGGLLEPRTVEESRTGINRNQLAVIGPPSLPSLHRDDWQKTAPHSAYNNPTLLPFAPADRAQRMMPPCAVWPATSSSPRFSWWCAAAAGFAHPPASDESKKAVWLPPTARTSAMTWAPPQNWFACRQNPLGPRKQIIAHHNVIAMAAMYEPPYLPWSGVARVCPLLSPIFGRHGPLSKTRGACCHGRFVSWMAHFLGRRIHSSTCLRLAPREAYRYPPGRGVVRELDRLLVAGIKALTAPLVALAPTSSAGMCKRLGSAQVPWSRNHRLSSTWVSSVDGSVQTIKREANVVDSVDYS